MPDATVTQGMPQNAPWMSDLGSLAQLGGNIYGLTQSGQLNSNANTVFQQSNPFGGFRPWYGNQLLQLMQDPSSVSKLPGYNFLLDQGVQAIDRSAAAPGGKGLGSGGEMTDLMTYGQGLVSQFYNQQVSTLAHLAGADINPANPYQALLAQGGTQSSIGSGIAGITAGLPGTMNLISRLFGGGGSGAPGTVPGQYDPNNSVFTGQPGQTSVDWTGQTGTDFGGLDNTGQDFFSGQPGQTSVDWGQGGDPNSGGLDLSGLWTNPRGAGGQAATGSGPGFGSVLNTGGSLAGIGVDLMQGSPTGYAKAGIGAASLASKNPSWTGMSSGNASTLNQWAGRAGNTLGLIQGIQQGGVAGDTSAAVNAAQLATRAGYFGGTAGALGTAAGYAAAPLAVYEFAKNWQSGNTGSDTLQGAEAGAAVGSVVPVIGTAIGAVIGAAVGALSSAFGGGRADPETMSMQNYVPQFNKNPSIAATLNPAQNFQFLAGVMDAKNNSPGHSTNLEQVFGRMGEGSLVSQMTQKINQAFKTGSASKLMSAQQIYDDVVDPWLNSKNAGIGEGGSWTTVKGDKLASATEAAMVGLIGQWQTGQLTNTSKVGIEGQIISGLQNYGV